MLSPGEDGIHANLHSYLILLVVDNLYMQLPRLLELISLINETLHIHSFFFFDRNKYSFSSLSSIFYFSCRQVIDGFYMVPGGVSFLCPGHRSQCHVLGIWLDCFEEANDRL